MPNQSLLYTGRVLACSQLHEMMHIARELCGGQICVTPDKAAFEAPETKPWLEKFYSVNENWVAEDRRKLLAFARDLLNSDYAGHRLTFQLFAQSPPFAHLAAVYRNFDWDGPLSSSRNRRVCRTASWPRRRKPFDKAPAQWVAARAKAVAEVGLLGGVLGAKGRMRIAGPRQSEMVAQGGACVLGAKQPASLQFRNHQLHEVLQAAGQGRELHHKSVRSRSW